MIAGTKVRWTIAASGYTARGLVHWCPACHSVHQFAIDAPNSNGARWTFDGNYDAPTFSPSMKISWGKQADPSCKTEGGVCHYILTAGVINFCGDCTHALAGQSVPLPDWPYPAGAYGGIEE